MYVKYAFRETLIPIPKTCGKSGCGKSGFYCIAIIMHDNWEDCQTIGLSNFKLGPIKGITEAARASPNLCQQ